VSITPQFPSSDSGQRRGAASRWPVLARLPDVSAELAATERTTKVAATGAISYRFDPPEGSSVGDEGSHVRTHTYATGRPPQVRVIQPRPRADIRTPLPGRESPILPQSNPFSIPGTRLVDTLAPLVRFLTLVAMFAAAGTWWFQMVRRHDRPARDPAAPPKTAAQPTLEPMPIPTEQPLATPTSVGPLGHATPNQGVHMEIDGRFADRSVIGFVELNPHPDITPELAAASGHPLPHVQTSEPQTAGVGDDQARAPAIARLPETMDSPPRQAQHDNNQSSLH